MNHTIVEIPRPAAFARHAVPHLIEAMVIPLALFYLLFWSTGIAGALVASLSWTYACIGRRLLRRERVPGVLILGAVLITARTTIAALTGSVFLYFLQPTLGTVFVALVFLGSVPIRRPIARRLAMDFCPLPPSLLERPFMESFFARITLLWAVVHLTNAAASFWLLINQSVGAYVITKQLVSTSATIVAIGASTLYFVWLMRANGLRVRLARTDDLSVSAA